MELVDLELVQDSVQFIINHINMINIQLMLEFVQWVGLGGGYGYLSRLHGLLSDNILEMKAVNAQGKYKFRSLSSQIKICFR